MGVARADARGRPRPGACFRAGRRRRVQLACSLCAGLGPRAIDFGHASNASRFWQPQDLLDPYAASGAAGDQTRPRSDAHEAPQAHWMPRTELTFRVCVFLRALWSRACGGDQRASAERGDAAAAMGAQPLARSGASSGGSRRPRHSGRARRRRRMSLALRRNGGGTSRDAAAGRREETKTRATSAEARKYATCGARLFYSRRGRRRAAWAPYVSPRWAPCDGCVKH